MLQRSRARLLGLWIGSAAFAFAAAASAQVKGVAMKEGEAIYDFFTDDLLAAGLANYGEPIKVRIGAARVQLIRPRTEFVREVLKSVEHL